MGVDWLRSSRSAVAPMLPLVVQPTSPVTDPADGAEDWKPKKKVGRRDSKAQLVGKRIVISESIQFEADKAVMLSQRYEANGETKKLVATY